MGSLPGAQLKMLNVGPGKLHSVRSPVVTASSAMLASAAVLAKVRVDTEIGCLEDRVVLLREGLNQC